MVFNHHNSIFSPLGTHQVVSSCDTGNEYDGRLNLRISAIFVILVSSLLGAWFPVFAVRHPKVGAPNWAFFIAKYFGSGVIVATAFIHLLAPANEALRNPCLTGPITEYTWVEGIVLMVIFVLFFFEIMVMRQHTFAHEHEHYAHGEVQVEDPDLEPIPGRAPDDSIPSPKSPSDSTSYLNPSGTPSYDVASQCPSGPFTPGDDHLSHTREHADESFPSRAPPAPIEKPKRPNTRQFDPDSHHSKLIALFILEFGIIFHSIFIGLTLAVSGEEFTTLYIVLTFHQIFEGLALGTRLASISWPAARRSTPYILAVGFAISTPAGIAIGLGMRTGIAPEGQTMLVVNGVLDSISAGILIYTGLVELMAHEFMFGGYLQRAPLKEISAAFGFMTLGAGVMAVLGKWA